ncbi:sugar ABC transporter substrate-binding protein [Erysipelotrichaceae bacterium MTC7]|nr:sugar ABC transporter substrate-binding protein [Erysipelotrichaceae bacterium MTC7]
MSKSQKQRFLIVSLILVLVGAIGFSVYQELQPKVIRLGVFAGSNWDVPNGASYKVIDDVIERYEKKHPGVKVVYESGILKDDYSAWLAAKVLQGDEPDVFMILGDDFNTLSELGVLQDMDVMIQKDEQFHKDAYYESALLAGAYQGTQYALPYESNPMLMFVNRTLLEKEGISIPKSDWTLEDFYRICTQVTKGTNDNGVVDQYGVYNYSWFDAVYSYGASLFNSEGTESYFGSEGVNQALRFIQKLDGLTGGYAVSAADFDDGHVAFTPMPLSEYRAYNPYPWRVKKYAGFEWDCIRMPSVLNRDSKTQMSTMLMSISNRSKHKALAWELLKDYVYDQDTQYELLENSHGISPLKEVTQSDEALALLQDNAMDDYEIDMKILNEVMENAMNSSKFRKYQGAMEMADYQIKQIINQHESIDTGLLSLQRKINKYLKE